MKTLTLLRHAKSSRKHPEIDDFDRPLNKRGRHEAPRIGTLLAQARRRPELIVSSPAARARATAEAVANALEYPLNRIIWDPRLYAAGPETLLAVLRKQSDDSAHAMLVGHNPGLTEFASALSGARLDNLLTASAYTLHLPIEHWRDATFGNGCLVACESAWKAA